MIPVLYRTAAVAGVFLRRERTLVRSSRVCATNTHTHVFPDFRAVFSEGAFLPLPGCNISPYCLVYSLGRKASGESK